MSWADVATKRDLEVLESGLRHDIGTLETRLGGRLDRLEGSIDLRIATAVRTTVLTTVGAVLATASLTLAAVRL